MTAKPAPLPAPESADLDAKRTAAAERARRFRERRRKGLLVLSIAIKEEAIDWLADLHEIEPHHCPDHPEFDRTSLEEAISSYLDQCIEIEFIRATKGARNA